MAESATIDLDGVVDGIGACWRELRLIGARQSRTPRP